MSEAQANAEQQALELRPPTALVIEGADDRALVVAREQSVARLRLVWNARRLLARIAAWGLALSAAVAFLIPKHYQSTARLMPPEQVSGTGAMLAALAGRLGGGWDQGPSQMPVTLASMGAGVTTLGAPLLVGVLRSDTVRNGLIQKFDLQKVYKTSDLEATREELTAHTGISEDVLSGIITITATDHDPYRAAAMAQEYVAELNWVVSHQSTSSAHRERVFLEQRLAQVRQELESAENDFSQFASKNGAIDIKEQSKAMVTAAATLQGELIAAASELEALRQIYTDNNVRVRATEARVSELKRQLEKFGGKSAGEASGIQSLYPPIRRLPVLGVSYADLYRKVRVEEAVFETLTQEYELAKVREAKEIPTVKVLDAPAVPQKKSFPPRLLITALGTVLALTCGTAWVLGHAAWEATDTADPRKTLATEMWRDMREARPWATKNGSGLGQAAAWLQKIVRRQNHNQTVESKPEVEQK